MADTSGESVCLLTIGGMVTGDTRAHPMNFAMGAPVRRTTNGGYTDFFLKLRDIVARIRDPAEGVEDLREQVRSG